MSFVEEVLLDEFRESPPDGLDEGTVVGDVGVFQVDPEADFVGHTLPFFGVAEDGLDALGDEFFDAVGLDGLLSVDAEFFLDFDLDGEAVSIPAGFARDVASAHGLVAEEDVFEDAGENVAVVGQSVSGRRTFVEGELLLSLARFEAFLEDAVALPEVANRLFHAGEVDDGLGLSELSFGHDFLVGRRIFQCTGAGLLEGQRAGKRARRSHMTSAALFFT